MSNYTDAMVAMNELNMFLIGAGVGIEMVGKVVELRDKSYAAGVEHGKSANKEHIIELLKDIDFSDGQRMVASIHNKYGIEFKYGELVSKPLFTLIQEK
jgi:hypothetical protein